MLTCIMLHPLDIILAIKLVLNSHDATQAELANELSVSASQINRAYKGCYKSGFVDEHSQLVIRPALVEFLVHGFKYVFPGELGPITRGIPTAHSAESIASQMGPSNAVYVWPHANGTVRGEAIQPIFKSVPAASLKDAKFYEAMALLDAIRVGRARERNLAASAISRIIGGKGAIE